MKPVISGRLANELKSLLGCDAVRVSSPLGKRMFLIIGFNRRSDGEWIKNGEPWSFDYLEEKCIASGNNLEELTEDAKFYKQLTGLTMQEFLSNPELVKRMSCRSAMS